MICMIDNDFFETSGRRKTSSWPIAIQLDLPIVTSYVSISVPLFREQTMGQSPSAVVGVRGAPVLG